jgi:gamma-glutamylcyclotransferase (GGCT)/AIG2-like uncharacterized protein YtfP
MSRVFWDDWVVDLADADEALQETDLFLVYGTLQSFSGNNTLLSMASLIGDVTTKDKYVLGNVGFPYAFPESVVPEEYSYLLFQVKGELWQVNDPSTVLDLDGLEGHPVHYERKVVETTEGHKAWMYLNHDWSDAKRCTACHLKEGVWAWRGY